MIKQPANKKLAYITPHPKRGLQFYYDCKLICKFGRARQWGRCKDFPAGAPQPGAGCGVPAGSLCKKIIAVIPHSQALAGLVVGYVS